MENIYRDSMLELGKLVKVPTKKEWLKLAKEKSLMNYISIRAYASARNNANTNFRDIYKEARNMYLLNTK